MVIVLGKYHFKRCNNAINFLPGRCGIKSQFCHQNTLKFISIPVCRNQPYTPFP